MVKLKLASVPDNKPVKVSVELPAQVYRDLVDYADVLGRETGQSIADASTLIAPMIQRFIETDRGFSRARRERPG